jgi:hypothetical protein
MLRAASDILSNSSMQQTPLSLSTKAPLSSTISFVSGSCAREFYFVISLTRARRASHRPRLVGGPKVRLSSSLRIRLLDALLPPQHRFRPRVLRLQQQQPWTAAAN